MWDQVEPSCGFDLSSDVSDSFKVNRNKANQLSSHEAGVIRCLSVVITTILSRYNRVPPVICVCGGKGAGKDIYARLIVNTLLFGAGEVAIIDGDPTNPLFGYPGLVKLGLLHETVTAPSPTNFNIDGLRRRRFEALETLFLGSFPKVRTLPFHVPLFTQMHG